jgi:hypothetical protein
MSESIWQLHEMHSDNENHKKQNMYVCFLLCKSVLHIRFCSLTMESSVVVYFPDDSWTSVVITPIHTAADVCDFVAAKRKLRLAHLKWCALFVQSPTQMGDLEERCLDPVCRHCVCCICLSICLSMCLSIFI